MNYHEERQMREAAMRRQMVKIGGLVFGALIVLILSLSSCYSIEQGERGVVTRFGAVTDISDPGLHFKAPFVDSVREIGVRTEWIEWRRDEEGLGSVLQAYSHDQQPAEISMKITLRAKLDATSIRFLYSTYGDLESFKGQVVIPRAAQAVKTVFGQFTAVSVIQNRTDFNARADAAVRNEIERGIEVEGISPVLIESVQITNIDFSTAYEHAVEERMKAEVEVAKVAQNLERTRKEAEIKVVQAEAEARAVKLRGEAEAAAIRARSDALRESPRLVDLTLAEKWNGVLPTTMVPGGAVPFIGKLGEK